MFPLLRTGVAVPKSDVYLTIGQTAELLGLTERTVRQMIADGRLTAYQLGWRVVRLRRNEIDAAMKPFGAGHAS